MKCTICDREVNDDVKICPNCGHSFDFVYKYNDDKRFRKRFVYTKKDMGLADKRSIVVVILLFEIIISAWHSYSPFSLLPLKEEREEELSL